MHEHEIVHLLSRGQVRHTNPVSQNIFSNDAKTLGNTLKPRISLLNVHIFSQQVKHLLKQTKVPLM